MINFDTYKESAKKWYSENRPEKNCPSDKKLLEWFNDFSMNEKAVSDKQRAFFNVVHDMKTGDKKPSGEAGKAAKDMSTKDIEDFAFTSDEEMADEKQKDEGNNKTITNKKGKNAKPQNLRADEGTGISKTVKNGVNGKTQNYKQRSVDFVRESNESTLTVQQIVQDFDLRHDHFENEHGKFMYNPATPDEFEFIELLKPDGTDITFADPINLQNRPSSKVQPISNITQFLDYLDEGNNLSLANRNGANIKPKNRKKRMNEAQLRDYISNRLQSLDRLSKLEDQKKKIVEGITAEEMKNLFMVIDADDESLIGKSFMNPPEGTSYVPVQKDDEEAADFGVAAESSNLPAGAEFDSNAPWNQEDNVHHGKTSVKNNLTLVAGNPKTEMIVQDDNKYFIINRENLEMNTDEFNNLAFDYGEVPIVDQYQDEDGDTSTDYNWEEAVLDTDDLLNAAADHILRGDTGSPQEYGAGEHFVYELTPELAEELWSQGSELESNEFVRPMIDYNKLKANYPQSF